MAAHASSSADGSEGEEAAELARDPAPTRVIYVMGAGRSGSTILGVALGNCEGVFYAGELDKWPPRAGVPPLPGEERARFWARVRGLLDADVLLGPDSRSFERSSLLLSARAWRTRRRLRGRYRELAGSLFAAVARTSGASCVVDSSHYPLRARELQQAPGVELCLLLLLRDPQAVVRSLGRKDVPERSFGVLAANAYLWLTHLLSAWVFARQPRTRRLVVRHEDFLADPRGVLEAILAMCGTGTVPGELAELRTGPVFQANRLVRSELVTLEPRPPAPSRQRPSRLTALLQWPLQRALARLSPLARRADAASALTRSESR
jgi:hypothetical protein